MSGASQSQSVSAGASVPVSHKVCEVECWCQCFAGWQARCLRDCVNYNIHYDSYEGGLSLKVLYISMNVNECVSRCSERVKG